MRAVSVALACGRYDRTAALFDGRVDVPGVDLVTIPMQSAETFVRMLVHEEFDAAEMSLAAYASAVARGDDRFVGIPAFPSRMLRHRDFYVSAASGIQEPAELRGRRVGMRRYHMTALVWQRGILSDDFGVAPQDIRWVRAGITRPGTVPARLPLSPPSGVTVEEVTDRSIDEMLVSGDLDAALLNYSPPGFRAGRPGVRRLFQDVRAVEMDYLRRTGIFPIMHLVVLRRSLYERHRWLAQTLLQGFERAKEVARAELLHTVGTSTSMLPFFHLDAEEATAMGGQDLWPTGLSANRANLATLLRYAHEQGVTEVLLDPQDLFPGPAHEIAGAEATVAGTGRSVGEGWD